MLVYSNGEWTARFTRNVKWASLNKLEGYGNHEIVFTYAANYGISRKVGVVFQKGELADTVTFTQAGTVTEPSLAFAKPAVALLKAPSRIFAPIDTNLRYCIDDVEASVTYYDADGVPGEPVPVVTRAESEEGDDKPQAQPVTPWISEVAITHEGVSFAVEDNEAGSTRLADLTLFIEDAEGTATTSVLSISQGIAEPSLKLDSSVETYEGYAQQCTIPATTNNLVPYADQIVYDITYDTPVEEGQRVAVGTHAHGRGADLLADSERQLGSPFRHAQPQLRRRIGRLRFGSLQNHPESLSHRRRLRDRTRNDPGRNLAGGLYRGDSWSATRPARTSFRAPRPDGMRSTAPRTTARSTSNRRTAATVSA